MPLGWPVTEPSVPPRPALDQIQTPTGAGPRRHVHRGGEATRAIPAASAAGSSARQHASFCSLMIYSPSPHLYLPLSFSLSLSPHRSLSPNSSSHCQGRPSVATTVPSPFLSPPIFYYTLVPWCTAVSLVFLPLNRESHPHTHRSNRRLSNVSTTAKEGGGAHDVLSLYLSHTHGGKGRAPSVLFDIRASFEGARCASVRTRCITSAPQFSLSLLTLRLSLQGPLDTIPCHPPAPTAPLDRDPAFFACFGLCCLALEDRRPSSSLSLFPGDRTV